MVDFHVYITKNVQKYLDSLSKATRERIFQSINQLVHPFEHPGKKLSGVEKTFRLRVGNYRILYKTYPKENIVVVIKVDLRKRSYNGL
jgi:mRNA interferase RelE/StbE